MRARSAASRRLFLIVLAIVLAALGAACAGPGGQSASTGDGTPARSGPKSITIVLPIDPTSLAGSMQGLGINRLRLRTRLECARDS